jgi:hypothetical protein
MMCSVNDVGNGLQALCLVQARLYPWDMKNTNGQRAAARASEKAQRIARLTEAHAVVATGVCPTCGTKLFLNLALSGWWQCGHVGAVGFQKLSGPHCDFQIFYDPTPEQHAAILTQGVR